MRKVSRKTWIFLIILAVLFVPFPTELVPEWEMQFRQESGEKLSNVLAQQSWTSYTYFAAGGYDQRCTDSEGVVVFPKRYLWSGLFSRVASPIFAEMMTLAHGSTGTDANIQIFDRTYISDNYYWRDKMELYRHYPEPLPLEGIANLRTYNPKDLPTCPM